MKIHHIFIAIASFLLMTGCKKDKVVGPQTDHPPKIENYGIEGKHYSIDGFLNTIPKELVSGTNYAVFVNKQGRPWRLKLENKLRRNQQHKTSKTSENFTADDVFIFYIDESFPSFHMHLSAGAFPDVDNSSPNPIIHAGAGVTNFDKGISNGAVAIKDGELIIYPERHNFVNKDPKYGFNTIFPTITLLDKTFSKVAGTKTSHPFGRKVGYSEIYFNLQYGIVGFADINDDLYVFDHFE